ncbi:hypothetical protein ABEF93_002449 [Exophiala dermatitidis]
MAEKKIDDIHLLMYNLWQSTNTKADYNALAALYPGVQVSALVQRVSRARRRIEASEAYRQQAAGRAGAGAANPALPVRGARKRKAASSGGQKAPKPSAPNQAGPVAAKVEEEDEEADDDDDDDDDVEEPAPKRPARRRRVDDSAVTSDDEIDAILTANKARTGSDDEFDNGAEHAAKRVKKDKKSPVWPRGANVHQRALQNIPWSDDDPADEDDDGDGDRDDDDDDDSDDDAGSIHHEEEPARPDSRCNPS